MRIFSLFKKNLYSQSGQDQFAYNLFGTNGFYLEVGAFEPIVNSNTYNLEIKANWKGISIENDQKHKKTWEKTNRRNHIIWGDAFKVDYQKLILSNILPKKINYLSCDIEPAENTFKILKLLIDIGLEFDFISFEHDKYQIGEKYETKANNFLLNHNYKIAIDNVYSRNKKNKIYETWYINKKIDFQQISYSLWKKTNYKNQKFYC